MKTHTLLAFVGLATGLITPAFSQTTPKELVGTRTLVSITLEYDGKKMDFFGANPRGQLTLDPNGRFSVIITRSDVPKFATNSRDAGTSEENKAAVQASIAYFGTYSVSEADNFIKYHIDGSTYPNWQDTDQERLFKLSGDELSLTNSTTSVGAGTAYSVWKAVK
jgi:Lipocalin-like domain